MECSFGYPSYCDLCSSLNPSVHLCVKPFYQTGSKFKVMLIGQDPTIFNVPSRVTHVLMLNEKNGQLRRWLENIFGPDNFADLEIYATNLVKCTFSKPPSTYQNKKYLGKYFENCKHYLIEEVKKFNPDLVLAFGEPSHYYFSSLLNSERPIPKEMNNAFDGEFYRVSIDSVSFDYSPCLHIKTYRVAETYGDKVKRFKELLDEHFK